MLSSHGREIGTQDALKKESRGLSQVAAGNLGSLDLNRRPQGASQGASEKSGILWTWEGLSELHWVWCNGKGSHLELRQEPKGSSPFKTPTTGSLKNWDRRVRPRLVWTNGTPLASRVVHRITDHLLSCEWNLRFFP